MVGAPLDNGGNSGRHGRRKLAVGMMVPIGLEGTKVFLVEDESLVAMMIEAMVEELGATVIGTGRRIDEALHFVSSRHRDIDVAILDINLGGSHSYEIAQVAHSHGIPIVFSTGYDDGYIMEEWRGRPLLGKPFQLSELENALTKAVALRGAREQP